MRVALGGAGLLVVALLCASCLDDLQEPVECPPAPRVKASGCVDVEPPVAGCFPQDKLECLSGTRVSCECGEGECPSYEEMCYPLDNCPTVVADIAGDAAKCPKLADDEFVPAMPPELDCICGCAQCMSLCDGYGPVFGVTTDSIFDVRDYLVPFVRLDAHMPSTGRAGVYLRMRGLASLGAMLLKGDPDDPGTLEPVAEGYLITNPLSEQFTEHVLYDRELLGLSAYSWNQASDKPSVLSIITSDEPTVELFEIDCIVPFYLPK